MSAFRTLPLDRGAERSVAALRLVAAASVAIAAVWIVFLRPNALAWACVALAVVTALAWVGMAAAGRRRMRNAERFRLALERDGLTLIEGAKERRASWDDVESIRTDEESLRVEVRVRDEEPIVIEPRYGGLGAHDLEAAIRAAKEEARPEAAD